MSCNAIATATAKVNLEVPEALARVLSTEDVRTVLIAQLNDMGLSPKWYPADPGRVLIQAGPYTIIWQGGRIQVDGPAYRRSEVQELGQTLSDTLQMAAGYILQEQVTQFLSQVAHVESSEQASNGARVVTIEF